MASSDGGRIRLRDVAAKGARMLDIACNRCERRGRVSVARMVAEHGADAPVGVVLDAVSADCPKRVETASFYDRCGVHCPTLGDLFLGPRRA
jgi:hypothetical protein